MVGGDEYNDIESRTRSVGYDNWAEAPRRHGGGMTRCRR